MAADEDRDPEVSFGDFSIEGFENPLVAHGPEIYVEEVDPDPAPLSDLVTHDADRLPWFGATPWAGPSDVPPGRRRAGRAVALLAASVTVALTAALVIWRLVG